MACYVSGRGAPVKMKRIAVGSIFIECNHFGGRPADMDTFRRGELHQGEAVLPEKMQLREAALRFAISHPGVTSAIVGFGEPEHVELAAEMLKQGPLPEDLASKLVAAVGTEKKS